MAGPELRCLFDQLSGGTAAVMQRYKRGSKSAMTVISPIPIGA